jgi:hypothetical protein
MIRVRNNEGSKMGKYLTDKYLKTVSAPPSSHKELGQTMGIETQGQKLPEFKAHWTPILKPYTMQAEPHIHDFDQYLCFFGSNPEDIIDLHGITELSLGADKAHMEKHIITKATTVFIPAGLYHCPLAYTKVDKPFMFLNMFFAREYIIKK